MLAGRLVNPAGPLTAHDAQQIAEGASPASRTSRLFPPPPRPGPVPSIRLESARGLSTHRPIDRCWCASPATWTACSSRHRPDGDGCRAFKSGRTDDLPVPATTQAGGRVPCVLIRPADRPAGPHTSQSRSTGCRKVCKSGWPDDPPCARHHPGPMLSAERLAVDMPCTVTTQVGRQNAESLQVQPSGQPAGHRHHPGRASDCPAYIASWWTCLYPTAQAEDRGCQGDLPSWMTPPFPATAGRSTDC